MRTKSFISQSRWLATIVLLLVLGVGSINATTIVSWADAARTANSQVSPTDNDGNNSGARLMSECNLNSAGSGGAAGSHYGGWTGGKSIYITGLTLSGYSSISLTLGKLRRRYSCTASMYTSTDGSSYSNTAFATKTLTNTNADWEISNIESSVQAIKITITGASNGDNLWLGSVTIAGTASSCSTKLTLTHASPAPSNGSS